MFSRHSLKALYARCALRIIQDVSESARHTNWPGSVDNQHEKISRFLLSAAFYAVFARRQEPKFVVWDLFLVYFVVGLDHAFTMFRCFCALVGFGASFNLIRMNKQGSEVQVIRVAVV